MVPLITSGIWPSLASFPLHRGQNRAIVHRAMYNFLWLFTLQQFLMFDQSFLMVCSVNQSSSQCPVIYLQTLSSVAHNFFSTIICLSEVQRNWWTSWEDFTPSELSPGTALWLRGKSRVFKWELAMLSGKQFSPEVNSNMPRRVDWGINKMQNKITVTKYMLWLSAWFSNTFFSFKIFFLSDTTDV